MGIARILITNAAGGLDAGLVPGSLLLAHEFVDPLLSHARSTRFPAGSAPPRAPGPADAPAAHSLAHLLAEAALLEGIPLERGALGWVRGPSYETPAEVAVLRRAGARAVTMSSVPEWTEAIRLGMDAAVLSVVTNAAAGRSGRLSHPEVLRSAGAASGSVGRLLGRLLALLPEEGFSPSPPAASAGEARGRLEQPCPG
jgi:purine-nucleoside phosphorylase